MPNKIKYIVYSERQQDKTLHMVVPVCESCINGNHNDYGTIHTTGEPGRRDCKSTDEDTNGTKVQCLCNPDWPGLYKALENKTYGIIYSNEAEAEKAKSGLENIGGMG